MRRMVGKEIHEAYYPDRYYCHDAENDDGLVSLGKTRHGEHLRINRRAAESDLVIYININLVPMDGGHKSVTVGPLRLRESPVPPRAARPSSTPTATWIRTARSSTASACAWALWSTSS